MSDERLLNTLPERSFRARARVMGSPECRVSQATIIALLAEGEPLKGALQAAHVTVEEFTQWLASPAWAHDVAEATDSGKLFAFHHERYNQQRAEEDLLTRYDFALETGVVDGLPPSWAARALRMRKILQKELPKRERPLCGARTREGGTCQARACPGSRRCRLHGGATPRKRPGDLSGAWERAQRNARRTMRLRYWGIV